MVTIRDTVAGETEGQLAWLSHVPVAQATSANRHKTFDAGEGIRRYG